MKIHLFFTFLLFFIFSPFLNAQNTPTDSLQTAFNSATTDTAKLSVLLQKRYTVYLGQPDLLLQLYKSGYEIAQRLGNKPLMSKIALFTGGTYAYGKSDEGTAFQWYQTATRIAEEAQDDESCEAAYYALGVIYDHQGFRDKMYENFLKAFSYSQRLNTPSFKPLRGLISVYASEGQFEKALDIAKKGIEMMDKSHISTFDKLVAYGDLLGVMQRIPNSKQDKGIYIRKINALLDNTAAPQGSEELISFMNLCFDINRYDLVEKFGNEVLKLPDSGDLIIGNKADAHLQLAKMYENQKNYPLSIAHWKQFTDIRMNIMKKAMTEEAGRKVIKAEAERDLLLKQKEADNNRWMAILGFSLAVLMLGGGIIVYQFYKREQERKKEVDAINATKDKLFSIIAHDLRSPIGTLKNNLTMTNYGMMSQAEFATVSKRLTSNVNALYQTLDNLLHWAYSQLKGTKVQPEVLHLREIANEEIRFLTENAKQKNISIMNDISQDTTAFADRNQISLVIRNLLSNGLKFTHSSGKIVLHTQNIEDRKTIFTITDNGIGMPPELQKQLFNIQNKTSRQGTAEEKGQGLGLLLVKEMVEANQGTLSIDSSENKGTVVNIQLPRLKE